MKAPGILCGVLLPMLAACVGSAPERIYALNGTAESGARIVASHAVAELQLARVLVPDYLDTTQIMVRAGPHELHSSRTGRWAERLSLGITHGLLIDLARELTPDAVTLSQPAESSAPLLEVEVESLDVLADGHCVLLASWTLSSADRRKVLTDGHSDLTTTAIPVKHFDDVAVVNGMAEAIARLARDIAFAVRALPTQAPARRAT